MAYLNPIYCMCPEVACCVWELPPSLEPHVPPAEPHVPPVDLEPSPAMTSFSIAFLFILPVVSLNRIYVKPCDGLRVIQTNKKYLWLYPSTQPMGLWLWQRELHSPHSLRDQFVTSLVQISSFQFSFVQIAGSNQQNGWVNQSGAQWRTREWGNHPWSFCLSALFGLRNQNQIVY